MCFVGDMITVFIIAPANKFFLQFVKDIKQNNLLLCMYFIAVLKDVSKEDDKEDTSDGSEEEIDEQQTYTEEEQGSKQPVDDEMFPEALEALRKEAVSI